MRLGAFSCFALGIRADKEVQQTRFFSAASDYERIVSQCELFTNPGNSYGMQTIDEINRISRKARKSLSMLRASGELYKLVQPPSTRIPTKTPNSAASAGIKDRGFLPVLLCAKRVSGKR
jgi:hypothetical protein